MEGGSLTEDGSDGGEALWKEEVSQRTDQIEERHCGRRKSHRGRITLRRGTVEGGSLTEDRSD